MSTSLQDIQLQIEALRNDNKELFESKKPIDLKISNNSNKIKKLQEQHDKEFLSQSNLSFKDKFEFLMFENGFSGNDIIYNELNSFFKSELPSLRFTGWFTFSEQKTISVSLIKGNGCNLQVVHDDINKIIDFIKPANKDGYKIIDLFEKTLSKYSSHYLQLSSDNVWSLKVGRSHTNFNSLLDLLTYCQEHHFYESSFPEDNEDED